MKIGLVKYLNARPLDYGFRKSGTHTLIFDTPANLSRLLLSGRLDCALISTAEVLRNSHILEWNKETGVCADDNVRSILYIEHCPDSERCIPGIKGSSADAALRPSPSVKKILTDSGSRSSVALLDALLYKTTGKLYPLEETHPDLILNGISSEISGLLIGDAALEFEKNYIIGNRDHKYRVIDLSFWWNRIFNLPFVFALWAYPRGTVFPTDFFTGSLRAGLSPEGIRDIVKNSDFPETEHYITESLHYFMNQDDLKAVELFRSLLHNLDTFRKDRSEALLLQVQDQ